MRENAKRYSPPGRADDTWLQSFSVAYDYPVVCTEDGFGPDNRGLVNALARREPSKRHRFVAFADDGVIAANPDLAERMANYAAVHSAQLDMIAPLMAVAGGETCKNDAQSVTRLLATLASFAIDRHSFVIAIGGGAMLDAVGYAAAIFHRGVRHVRFPTTVLSQCDSGDGVKNPVNAHGLKNLIGTFAPPWAIVNVLSFIDTLPPREKRACMAEAVKVALIRDRALFEWLESSAETLARFSPAHFDHLIKQSAELHMRQIRLGGDPFEVGSARPLDFGHWSAHKLEYLTQNTVNHGEAVAIGIVLDARYSVMCGLLAEGLDERVLDLLERLGFALWHPALQQPSLLQRLQDFREHLGGELTVTLLADIGRGVEVHEMDLGMIDRCIDWLQQRVRP